MSNFAYLFALKPVRGYVTFDDVHDAVYIAKRYVCPRQREALYLSYGLDPQIVEKYYHTVCSLEKMYEQPDRDQLHRIKFGAWSFYIGRNDLV